MVSLLGDGILTSVGLSSARTGFREIPWAYEDARTAAVRRVRAEAP